MHHNITVRSSEESPLPPEAGRIDSRQLSVITHRDRKSSGPHTAALPHQSQGSKCQAATPESCQKGTPFGSLSLAPVRRSAATAPRPRNVHRYMHNCTQSRNGDTKLGRTKVAIVMVPASHHDSGLQDRLLRSNQAHIGVEPQAPSRRALELPLFSAPARRLASLGLVTGIVRTRRN